MRRAARVDRNHGEIVGLLRAAGVEVVDLSAVGGGVPDLLCGAQGRWVLVEVKDGSAAPSRQRLRGKPTDPRAQAGFHALCAAKGLPCVVARSGAEALHLLRLGPVRVEGARS